MSTIINHKKATEEKAMEDCNNPLKFSFYGFNTLPRPDALTQPETWENADLDMLDILYPYMFKPNRVVAIHPDTDSPRPPSHPIKDRKSQWITRLVFPKDLGYLSNSVYLIVLSREGRFTLWQYRGDKKDCGLYQVFLQTGENTPPAEQFYLFDAEHSSTDDNENKLNLPYVFTLTRLTQSCNSEGVMFINLHSPDIEYSIRLNFGHKNKEQEHECVPYSCTAQKSSLLIEGHFIHQIGGWRDNRPFLWKESLDTHESGQLYFNSAIFGFSVPFMPKDNQEKEQLYLGEHLLEAIEEKGFFIAGGGDSHLWFYAAKTPDEHGEYLKKIKPKDINEELNIPGYVGALELLTKEQEDDKNPPENPLIFAGSDDCYLYILNRDGKILQQAGFEGAVDGIVLLDNAKDKTYCDLALLVRGHGVMCVRIFFDELGESGKKRKKKFKDILKRRLEENPELTLDSNKQISNLLAATDFVFQPTKEKLSKLNKRLRILDYNVVACLNHLIYQKIRGKIDQNQIDSESKPDLELYLKMLYKMATASYHTRLIVRHWQGWLMLKSDQAFQAKKYRYIRKKIDGIIDVLPGAKTRIRKTAIDLHEKIQQKDNNAIVSFSVKILGLGEFLSHGHVFSKLSMVAEDGFAQVDAITVDMANPEQPEWIYARRGKQNLYSLYVEHKDDSTVPVVILKSGNWSNKLSINKKGTKFADIRKLLMLDKQHLLVVADTQFGIAKKNVPGVRWHCFREQEYWRQPLWSADIYKEENGKTWLALAGEWRPGGHTAPVYLFNFQTKKALFIEKKFTFGTNKHFNKRMRFSALRWDKMGGLWAVTERAGCLFHWPCTNTFEDKREPQLIAEFIGSEHCLHIEGNIVLCGSQDGLLRAFDYQGSLQWLSILPGTVMDIVTVSQTEENDSREFADIAVITNKSHIFLYKLSGKRVGILHLPDRHLTKLVSGKLTPSGTPQYIVGTSRGEVHLLEEVEQNWEPENYMKNLDIDERVHKQLDACRHGSIAKKQIKKWLSQKGVIAEPLRAAWAAKYLIFQPSFKVSDFNCVLKALESIRKDFTPSSLLFRAHVFGSCGTHFYQLANKMSSAQIEKLFGLADDARDGAFASFLFGLAGATPEDDPEAIKKLAHIKELKEVPRDKIRVGKPYTSDAVLQAARHLGDDFLNHFILDLLENADYLGRTVYAGFAEGLLAVLFRKLFAKLKPENQGILWAISEFPMIFGDLAKSICDDSLHPEAKLKKNFCRWTDRYCGILFSKQDEKTWKNLSALFKAQEPDNLPMRRSLQKLAKKLEQDVGEASADLRFLNAFFKLLPSSLSALPQTGDLPSNWKIFLKNTGKLRLERNWLYQNAYLLTEQEIDEHKKKEIKPYLYFQNTDKKPVLALMRNFHTLWESDWKNTFNELLDYHSQQDKPQDGTPLIAIREMFKKYLTLEDFRFFRILRLPIANGNEMVLQECRVDDEKIIKIYRLHSSEKEYLKNFKPKQEGAKERDHAALKTDIFSIYHRFYSATDTVWQTEGLAPALVPHTIGVDISLSIKTENGFQFVVLLMARKPITFLYSGYELGLLKDSLLGDFHNRFGQMFTNLAQRLFSYQQEREQNWVNRLERSLEELLDPRKAATKNHKDIEYSILRTIQGLVSSVDGILLFYPESPTTLALHGKAEKDKDPYIQHPPMRFSAEQHPFVSAWKKLEASSSVPGFFFHDWQQEKQKLNINLKAYPGSKPLNDSSAWAMFPVRDNNSENKHPLYLLVFYTTDSTKPYLFYQGLCRRIGMLLKRLSWPLNIAHAKDLQYDWERAIAHEIHTNMKPINDALEEVKEDPEDINLALAVISWHVGQVHNLAQNYLDLQTRPIFLIAGNAFDNPGEVLKTILDEAKLSNKWLRVEYDMDIKPDFAIASVWQCRLVGFKKIFTRIIRVLMDNAFKYGEQWTSKEQEGTDETVPPKIVIRAKIEKDTWVFSISNPGHMTANEEQLVFATGSQLASLAREHDGAHVGLAASKHLVDNYNGQLEVKSDIYNRVQATLKWPLVKQSSREIK